MISIYANMKDSNKLAVNGLPFPSVPRYQRYLQDSSKEISEDSER